MNFCCCSSASATRAATWFYNNPSLSSLLPINHRISNWKCQIRVVAVSASADAGSPSYYPEPLLDAPKKQKKRTVAGIDQDDLVDPSELADPDSCFLEFKGVQIHHKIYEHHQGQTSSVPRVHPRRFPFILLHGFGASLYSWNPVLKPLTRLTGSKVVAFDRPAFGLTSRLPAAKDNKSLNPYSLAFSVLATLNFLDILAADKAILIGHSAGALVAVNAYFEAPERVAALILVAPAIMAPLIPPKDAKKKQTQHEGDNSASEAEQNPFTVIWRTLSKLSMYIIQPILKLLKGMVNMASFVYKKTLAAILRSTIAVMLLRMLIDKFGIATIRSSWYDASKIPDDILNSYKKPLRSKNWEKALLEFTIALLMDSAPLSTTRLSEITCPVLIITGDTDRLVPSWNAKRLSRAIPGSSLEVIEKCGHLPHEEKVEEFVSIIDKFLQRVVGSPDEQLLQPAAA